MVPETALASQSLTSAVFRLRYKSSSMAGAVHDTKVFVNTPVESTRPMNIPNMYDRARRALSRYFRKKGPAPVH